MKPFKFFSIPLVLCVLFCGCGTFPAEPTLARERIEWCDIWFTDAEKEERPRVLLIGDSIVRGYFGPVEKALGDMAYCGRLTTSRSICDPVFFQELRLVLSQYKFDVIHFNNGLHGWGYTEEAYAAAFDKFLRVLREESQGAQLIWASTTPVQPGSGMGERQGRVAKRNSIASERVAKAKIPTTDLNARSLEHPEHFSKDGVHFSAQGKDVQSKAVAKAIGDALSARK
jgi:hypothetical protein